MKNESNLLTAQQVAEILRLAPKTVIVMAREARIPSVRFGRIVRFDPQDIRRWIENKKR